ncbi:MAG TPA: RNA polymerase sigma factor region1.1 domain-containing protein, partial [Streptosporangiaceae bacterium]|nr:RNA polymerase sigma factor region1.1 domain-containing protein [Streptosporangiaceae bacterium]
MPRTAMAAPSARDGEASTKRVDELIHRGRSQGHLSLSELRTAFEQAGVAPAEGRSILRELAEAGVRLADERQELSAKDTRTVSKDAAGATAAKGGRRAKGGSRAGAAGETAAAAAGSAGAAPEADAAEADGVPIEIDDMAIEAEAEAAALAEA